jgi:ABC-type microcin C transport system permease subunit YejB
MSGRPVGQEILWAVIFGFAVAFGVGLRRWKGDAFRSNIVSNVVMWVGTAVGYFLVADRDDRSDEQADPE